MIAKPVVALEAENQSLRRQVKRLREKLKQTQQEVVELQRWGRTINGPVTPEEIAETERWWKGTWAAFQRGELLDGEEVLSEIERTFKNRKQSWKKKRTSRSSSRKR